MGIRPLARTGDGEDTAALSREHTMLVSESGLLTIAGGKWTTYRRMAEDAVEHAATLGGLDPGTCVTEHLNIHGFHEHAERFGELAHYGADALELQELLEQDQLDRLVHPRLLVRRADVVWAARREMARTIDDVLARRTRALLLDARAAMEAAGTVAAILAQELGRDEGWVQAQVDEFLEIARSYVLA